MDGGNHDLVPKAVIDQLVRSKRIITYFQILSIAGIIIGWISLWRESVEGEFAILIIANSIEVISLIYLYLFTMAIKATTLVPIWENAALAFRWLKAYWKFVGILSILLSCGVLVYFLFTFMTLH